MSLQSMLRQSAQIERLTETVREDGAVITNWKVAQNGVPCLLEKIEASQANSNSRVRGYFPDDTDLQPDTVLGTPDRITVDGVAYLVTGTAKYNGFNLSLMVAELELVRELS